MTVNQKELIKRVATAEGLPIKTVTTIIENYWAEIEATVAKDETVVIYNRIKLEPQVRKERIGRNPQTGEELVLPETKYVSVKALKKLKTANK